MSGKLNVTLPSDLEIAMTYVFDAPRHLVFEAMSKCEHIAHWWGPRGYIVKSCEMDFRVGGKWRFVHLGPDGKEYGFRGEYRTIEPPATIAQTFEFEGMPGHISLDTLTLEERDGRTTATTVSRYDSKEDRDGMLQSGMEAGATESYDRLAEYLATGF